MSIYGNGAIPPLNFLNVKKALYLEYDTDVIATTEISGSLTLTNTATSDTVKLQTFAGGDLSIIGSNINFGLKVYRGTDTPSQVYDSQTYRPPTRYILNPTLQLNVNDTTNTYYDLTPDYVGIITPINVGTAGTTANIYNAYVSLPTRAWKKGDTIGLLFTNTVNFSGGTENSIQFYKYSTGQSPPLYQGLIFQLQDQVMANTTYYFIATNDAPDNLSCNFIWVGTQALGPTNANPITPTP